MSAISKTNISNVSLDLEPCRKGRTFARSKASGRSRAQDSGDDAIPRFLIVLISLISWGGMESPVFYPDFEDFGGMDP